MFGWTESHAGKSLVAESDDVINRDVIIDTDDLPDDVAFDDDRDDDRENVEPPTGAQASLYLYAHRPPWSTSGLFRMVFSPLGVCLGYVASEVYDEASAKKQIPFSGSLLSWYKNRILKRRDQLEERYNAAVPFTIEWQQIDRRNKVMLAHEIRRFECQYSVPVERLDRGLYSRSKLTMQVIIHDQANRQHSFAALPGFDWEQIEESLAATGLPIQRSGMSMWLFTVGRFLNPALQVIGGVIWAVVITGMLLAAPNAGGILGMRAKLGFSVGFGVAVALVGAWKLVSEIRQSLRGE